VTANSPVASVSAQGIQFEQPSAVEEFIKTLPAAAVGVDSNVNNGSGESLLAIARCFQHREDFSASGC
jgi:hypothetical protein